MHSSQEQPKNGKCHLQKLVSRFDDNPVDKSLIYTINNKGPRIEPWGTPAFTAAHPEAFVLILISHHDARLCQALLICQLKHPLLPVPHHQSAYRSFG